MRILLPLLLFSSFAYPQTWVKQKSFLPYYVPGDYEVWKIKQDTVIVRDTLLVPVHDTIYLDSCRIRMELAKRDTIGRIIPELVYSGLDSIATKRLIWGETGRSNYGPVRYRYRYKNKWRYKYVYRKPAKVKKPPVVKNAPQLPTEIMLEVSWFNKKKRVDHFYSHDYLMVMKESLPLLRGKKRYFGDSIKVKIYLPKNISQ